MWQWIDKVKKFLNTVTDRFLGRKAAVSVRNRTTDYGEGKANALTDDLVNDRISLGDWERGMRQSIKDGYIQQYLLGRGGQTMLTQADYGSMGGMIADQYRYLDGFVDEIAAGNLSPGQIAMRARMYMRSTVESYERANGRAFGIPEGKLPAYPGDGNSCLGLTNCRCSWEIDEVFEGGEFVGWNCFWTLGASDPCDLCQEESIMWNPFFIPA